MGQSSFSGPVRSWRGFQAPATSQYFDDFIGAGKVAIPTSAESGMDWISAITGAAPPTVAGVADAVAGLVACTLTSDAQAQEAALYHGDQRNIDITNRCIIEGRVKVPVLPTLLGLLYFGLAGDRNATPGSITYSAWFSVNAGGNLLAEMDDNATDTSVDTTIDLVANDIVAWKIDFTDINNVKYYVAVNPTEGQAVNYNQVASGTTFAYAATGANAVLQPYFAAAKASGAGVGTLQVDFVNIIQDRP